MQITSFEVEGLFNRYNYTIPLQGILYQQPALLSEEIRGPSVTILYGPNGSGKTTILRMISGILDLDFNIFRAVPFSSALLRFNTGEEIKVVSENSDGPIKLKVFYKEIEANLNPLIAGPNKPEEDAASVEELQSTFERDTASISSTLIDTNRFLDTYRSNDFGSRIRHRYGLSEDEFIQSTGIIRQRSVDSEIIFRRKLRDRKTENPLADNVKRFVNLAQGDYRTFFASKEPELFARIIRRLVEPASFEISREDLLNRLAYISDVEQSNLRLGLRPDSWDFEELARILSDRKISQEALSVIGAYVDVLESRNADRKLIAERLLEFEHVVNEFFDGIIVAIDADLGFRIESAEGHPLYEDQLSSGQYHLLFLLVEALTTRRRGTVIAIDEPELSMHLSWQRKLIKALIRCAAGAEPQFIFATHSPDLAANFQESMISLGEIKEE